jgi:hypothetical protein
LKVGIGFFGVFWAIFELFVPGLNLKRHFYEFFFCVFDSSIVPILKLYLLEGITKIFYKLLSLVYSLNIIPNFIILVPVLSLRKRTKLNKSSKTAQKNFSNYRQDVFTTRYQLYKKN